ncbi:MAG: S-adenosylmethionine decarboxylase proenzyme [Candidatus Moanabacter tarae]|uniref:S-adenosylmethionine decarboxylase proenzyme n=1 Tax=Candidatus Moanibacter tarae TaxID=2200854 RepID=A0A2Z4AJY0_9BACT|nr:MAG: S-adenosylmethionine decarboxylase proenzyme [Candidatus Moanabacter tarae]|tara:strand:- start:13578 stop:13979 length:402 start_codon:yes stop_codon:yes gene_type:complete
MKGAIEHKQEDSQQSVTYRVLGRHYLFELYGCAEKFLVDIEVLKKSMISAAETAGATVVNSVFHGYSPQGLSGVVVISESHLTVHTWPELNYAAVDVFTCGEGNLGEDIGQALIRTFEASEYHSREIDRGISI